MAVNNSDSVKNMIGSIGAAQTLVEHFPMRFSVSDDLKIKTSFDVLTILFKIFKINREQLIDTLTDFLCGGMTADKEGTGALSKIENVVKYALEANIINILNCSTNPIISNNLLDEYTFGDDSIKMSGKGVLLDVGEINFSGLLNKAPYDPRYTGKNKTSVFYFDIDEYNTSTVYKSNDFNAYLWYIINKSDASQTNELIWDDRYGKNEEDIKNPIIRCTYIDENYPNTDKIRVQICGARDGKPANYFKTRKLSKTENEKDWVVNKTIFEFNHDFIQSIKLYEPKVMVAEIVEYLLGEGNISANLGLSLNEQIVKEKIDGVINKIIKSNDTEINDCFYTFTNDEYNSMLEKAEVNRFNNTNITDNLTNITSNSTINDDKTTISQTLTELSITPAQDPEVNINVGIDYNWEFELYRAFLYPLARPLFSPKVLFLLNLNKKIMGSLEDVNEYTNIDFNQVLSSLIFILQDIVKKLQDMLIDVFLNLILDELKPLVELLTSRLLLETLNNYKNMLLQIYNACFINLDFSVFSVNGTIDNVNYADIIPSQEEPGQTYC